MDKGTQKRVTRDTQKTMKNETRLKGTKPRNTAANVNTRSLFPY